MKHNKTKKIGGFFFFIAIFAIITAIIMLLWNALIPSIIGWSTINYWQSAGLIILCRLLLGGIGKFHMAGHMLHKYKNSNDCHPVNMMQMHEKLKCMSSDERREYIRKRMCGIEDENEVSYPNNTDEFHKDNRENENSNAQNAD